MNLTTNPLRPTKTFPTRFQSQNTEASQDCSCMSKNLTKWWISDHEGSRKPHELRRGGKRIRKEKVMRKEDKVEQRGGKVIEDREEKEEWKDEKKMERQQHKGKEWSEEVRGGVGIWTSPSLTTGLSLGSWQDCPPLCQYRKTGQGSCWQYASTGTDTHAGSVNSQTLVCSSLSWRHLGEEVNV